MRVVELPVREAPAGVHGQEAVGLRREGQRSGAAALGADLQEGRPGGAVVELGHPRPVRGHEALVAPGGAERDDGRAVGREVVDLPEAALLPRPIAGEHLPGADPAGGIADHQGPVADQEAERGDRGVGAPAGRDRLPHPRRGLAEIHPHDLARGGAGEQVFPALIQEQRPDLSPGGELERVAGLLLRGRADQRLALPGPDQHDLTRSQRGGGDRAAGRGGVGHRPNGPAAGIDDDRIGRRDLGLDPALALGKGHGEADLDRHHAPRGEPQGDRPAAGRRGRDHRRAAQRGERRGGQLARLRHPEQPDPGRRDDGADLAVLVHRDRQRRGLDPHRHRPRQGPDRGRRRGREERDDLGRDDEEDGQDGRDDRQAAERDDPAGQPVDQQAVAGPPTRDRERASRDRRPARPQGLFVDTQGLITLLDLVQLFLGDRRAGSGSSRPSPRPPDPPWRARASRTRGSAGRAALPGALFTYTNRNRASG